MEKVLQKNIKEAKSGEKNLRKLYSIFFMAFPPLLYNNNLNILQYSGMIHIVLGFGVYIVLVDFHFL